MRTAHERTSGHSQIIVLLMVATGAGKSSCRLLVALRGVYAASQDRDDAWALSTEFALYALRNAEARATLAASGRAMHDTVTALVEQQCAHDGVDPPIAPDLIASMYIALFTGLWQQQALDPEAVDDDALAEAIVFLRKAITALGRPRRKKRNPAPTRPQPGGL